MSRAQIMAAILKMPLSTIVAAHKQYVGGETPTHKAVLASALASQIEGGFISLDNIANLSGLTGKIMPGVPAFPTPAIPVDKFSEVEARILSRLDTADGRLQSVAAGLEATAQEVRAKVDAIRVDDAAVRAQVAQVVADAFKPFAAAVQSAGAQSAVGSLVQHQVIDRKSCAEVFGVDLKDRRGNPVMVDIWDNPAAPAIDPLFIWTPEVLKAMVLSQDGGKLWLGGPKGTGKTETARQFAARTGRGFVRFNFRKFTTSEDYIGATGLEGGRTEFKPGPVLVGLTTPGTVVLLDEVSNVDPGEAAPLNGLLEPNGSVSIGGRVWSVAPGVTVVAADNTLGNGDDSGRYAGTRLMNSALLDRFALVVRMDYLPRELESDAIRAHTGCDAALALHVVDAVRICREKLATGEVVDAPSIRSAIGFVRALRLMTVQEAWTQAIANRQPMEGAAALEAVFCAAINQGLIDSLAW
jgi:MoxR-like ATPase